MTLGLRDKIAGSLYGLLIGDALGCSVEGFSREKIQKDFGQIDEMLDGQSRWRPAGLHSDDGQQALALCDAILRSPASPTLKFANLLVDLRDAGPSGFRRFGLHRGTGSHFRSTVMALKSAQPLRAENVYVGSQETAGNGAAVRIAPLAVFYRDDDERILDELIATARVTHCDARGVAAAAAVAWIVKSALATSLPPKQWAHTPFLYFVRRCEEKCNVLFETSAQSNDFSRVLELVLKRLDAPFDVLLDLIEEEANACSFRPVQAGSGFAVASVVLSITLFFRASSLEEALIETIACGDDTDATAAMVGQMCGARFGRYAIPNKWMNTLLARAALDDRVLALQMRWPSFEPAFSLVELEEKWCEPFFAGPSQQKNLNNCSETQKSAASIDEKMRPPLTLVEAEKTVDVKVSLLKSVSSFSEHEVPSCLPILNSDDVELEYRKEVSREKEVEENVFSLVNPVSIDEKNAENTVMKNEDAEVYFENEDEEELPFWMSEEPKEDASLQEKKKVDVKAEAASELKKANNIQICETLIERASPQEKPLKIEKKNSLVPEKTQLSMFDALTETSCAKEKSVAKLSALSSEKTKEISKMNDAMDGNALHAEINDKQKGDVDLAIGAGSLTSSVNFARKNIAISKIKLEQGDITKVHTDAIVNAANTSLLGGGGVDGAIHRAGGPTILDECRDVRARQGGCKTGEAVITSAGELDAVKVIHAVGPRWRGGEHGEAELLKNAYLDSLKLARKYGLRKVAFSSISTGVYRFPIEKAAQLAMATVTDFLEEHDEDFDEIRFVLLAAPELWVYEKALADLVKS